MGPISEQTAPAHKKSFPTRIVFAHVMPMRRPDKTEVEFILLMMLLLVPFAYYAIRTMLALLGA
jgi:hypothetical protein